MGAFGALKEKITLWAAAAACGAADAVTVMIVGAATAAVSFAMGLLRSGAGRPADR